MDSIIGLLNQHNQVKLCKNSEQFHFEQAYEIYMIYEHMQFHEIVRTPL